MKKLSLWETASACIGIVIAFLLLVKPEWVFILGRNMHATGTMDKKPITGKVIVTTPMRYDMTHDMLYLVSRDSNCVVPDGGADGSRPVTASQLCMALSASIREAFNRIPLQITPERGRGFIAYVSVDDSVAGNIRTVTLTFVRLKLWMLLCVLVIVAILAYAVYLGRRFPRHEVRPRGRSE